MLNYEPPHILRARRESQLSTAVLPAVPSPMSFSRVDAIQALQFMVGAAAVFTSRKPYSPRLFPGGDGGLFENLSATTTLDEIYHAYSRRFGHQYLSNENDPRDVSGLPQRLGARALVERCVTNLARRGGWSAAQVEGDTTTSLLAFCREGSPVGGVCLRPEAREAWIGDASGISRFTVRGQLIEETDYSVKKRLSAIGPVAYPKVVRVNAQRSSDGTLISDAIIAEAARLSRGRYQFVAVAGGGAEDALGMLLSNEIDIVLSGEPARRWSTWHTDPFVAALSHFGNRAVMTDYYNESLRTSPTKDLCPSHRNGVAATIGHRNALESLTRAMRNIFY